MRGLTERTQVRSQKLALEIIQQREPGVRVDQLLRQVLARGRYEPVVRRSVSQMVFTYYRWLGLVTKHQPLRAQLSEALDMAAQFARTPERFTDELLQKIVPDWVMEATDLDHEWLRLIQTPPELWIRCQAGIEGVEGVVPGKFSVPDPAPNAGSFHYQGEADLFRTTAFQEGRFEIQDLSSQWVSAICQPAPGEWWWDACAGEGGKFLDLACRMSNRGQIWVTDRSARRLQQLRRRAARAGVYNYRWRQADLRRGDSIKSRFDGVLLDAPCSGLGTWQRNPDARWSTSIDSIDELASIQQELLRCVSNRVKPTGRLVYAVCTLSTLETSAIADWFDVTMTGFVPWRPDSVSLPPNVIDPIHSNRFWFGKREPGGNGMFVAAWQRETPADS